MYNVWGDDKSIQEFLVEKSEGNIWDI